MKNMVMLALALLTLPELSIGGVEEALAATERGDYKTAFKEFVALAEKGDVLAMVEVGTLCFQGEGVKKDYSQAMNWYVKAFKKGNGDAYNNIGVLYRDGLGVEANHSIAYALFFIVHMRGLGDDGTQIRAGRNLEKTARLMKPDAIEQTLKMTEKYILTFVENQGKLDAAAASLKFSKEHAALEKLADL